MSTHGTAKTQYILANNTTLAYRRLGQPTGTPLVLLIHFRGTMDHWDPLLINSLVQTRPFILLDNARVGKSDGEIPTTFHGWALYVIALLDALRITQIDLLGFSMGGGAAQHVALAKPGLVRKLIIAGSRTSKGPNTVIGPRDIFRALATSGTEEEFKDSFALSFFNPTPHGQEAARRVLDRIYGARKEDRSTHLSVELGKRQTEAMTKFSVESEDNPYERIGELDMPVLVANGDTDLLIPTVNSVQLQKLLPRAQ